MVRGTPRGAGETEVKPYPIPGADPCQNCDSQERGEGEPEDVTLSVWHHDHGRQQRTERRSRVASDLEERLGESVAPAGGKARDPRRLGMENRRTDADHRRGGDHRQVVRRERQEDEAAERHRHAERKGVGLWLAVGVEADCRLEDRAGHLEGEGNQADLGEIERERFFEQRIDRRDQRLDRVVEKVGATQRDQDRQRGLLRWGRRAPGIRPVNRIGGERLRGVFGSWFHALEDVCRKTLAGGGRESAAFVVPAATDGLGVYAAGGGTPSCRRGSAAMISLRSGQPVSSSAWKALR